MADIVTVSLIDHMTGEDTYENGQNQDVDDLHRKNSTMSSRYRYRKHPITVNWMQPWANLSARLDIFLVIDEHLVPSFYFLRGFSSAAPALDAHSIRHLIRQINQSNTCSLCCMSPPTAHIIRTYPPTPITVIGEDGDKDDKPYQKAEPYRFQPEANVIRQHR